MAFLKRESELPRSANSSQDRESCLEKEVKIENHSLETRDKRENHTLETQDKTANHALKKKDNAKNHVLEAQIRKSVNLWKRKTQQRITLVK